MPVFDVGLVFILALAGYSDANYCVCNSGLSDPVLQKNIDYACGAGADCSPILQNGPCFNPNTVKDHCNYAVNSYYQKKGNAPGNCDFGGTATVSPNPPSAASGCVYPSSPGNAGGTTPTTNPPPARGTPINPSPTRGTPVTPTPPGGGGAATPGTFPGGSPPPPGSFSPVTPVFGPSPTGPFDSSAKLAAPSQSSIIVLVAMLLMYIIF